MASSLPSEAFSHWYHLFEGFKASTQEFYSQVEAAIQKRQIPKCQPSRIAYREGGMLSSKREYLRIRRGELAFDICGAPFGTGYFVSWWLTDTSRGCLGCLSVIPVLGPLWLILFNPATYYKIDTALMFQESVHLAVLEVLDGMTQAQGLRGLTETERKPIMKDFFR